MLVDGWTVRVGAGKVGPAFGFCPGKHPLNARVGAAWLVALLGAALVSFLAAALGFDGCSSDCGSGWGSDLGFGGGGGGGF